METLSTEIELYTQQSFNDLTELANTEFAKRIERLGSKEAAFASYAYDFVLFALTFVTHYVIPISLAAVYLTIQAVKYSIELFHMAKLLYEEYEVSNLFSRFRRSV